MNKKEIVLADEAARETIRNDFTRNIAVSAGAGSGKTREMVERIVNGLALKVFTADRIAAITFTRKAAGELRTRVIGRLFEAIAGKKGTPEGDGLERQLKLMVTAQVSTIHSFCANILKERPIEAGVDPAFSMADDADSAFFDRVFTEYVDDKLSGEGDSPEGRAMRSLLVDFKFDLTSDESEYGNNPSVKELLRTFVIHRDSRLAMLTHLDVKETLSELDDFLAQCIEDTVDADTLNQKFISDRELLAAMDIDGSSEFEFSLSQGGCGGPSWKDFRHQAKDHVARLVKRMNFALRYDDMKKLYDGLDGLFRSFVSFYRECERRDGIIDNEDLLIMTRDLLRDHEEVREFFKRRFSHFFVDEFQDTDPVQTEILFFLAEEEGGFERDWTKIVPAPGRLFVIGDDKQAIYGFRRADVQSFRRALDIIGTENRVNLTTNFRSSQKVLDFINGHFSETMTGRSPYHPPYQALVVYPENVDASPGEKIKSVGNPPSWRDDMVVSQGIGADNLREMQSAAVCAWIEANRGTEFEKWREVTVLVRENKALVPMQKALEERGIPCEIAGSRSYFGRYEIVTLHAVLRAIADPSDNIATYGALKGPFFGFTDADLHDYFSGHSFNRHIKSPEGEVAAALRLLGNLHDRSLTACPDEIVLELYRETGALLSFASGYRPAERIANLLKAVEFARSMRDLPFFDFVGEMERAIEDGREMTDLRSRVDGDDAVQVMTIHRAKGLENRVVYIADAAYMPKNRRTTLVHENLIYLCEKSIVLYEYDDVLERQRDREEAEEERLRYVAATRARECLVVNHFDIKMKRAKFPDGFIHKYYRSLAPSALVEEVPLADLAPGSGYFEDGYYPAIKPLVDTNMALGEAAWGKAIESSRDDGLKPAFGVVSPSLAVAAGDDNTTFDTEYSVETMTVDVVVKTSERSVLGTIVHRVLELAAGSAGSSLRGIAESVIRSEMADVTPDEAVSICEMIMKHDAYRRALASKRVYRELPIVFRDGDSLVDGFMDLLFEEDGGWVIVDYKVLISRTAADVDEIREHYRTQLDLYQKGLEKVGIKVKEKIVVAATRSF